MLKFLVSLFLILASLSSQVALAQLPLFNDWIGASRRIGLDPSLLYSMALAESGKTVDGKFVPHPFAIAVGVDKDVVQLQHEGYYPETYEQAKAILENLLNAGYKNIGVGMLQINLKANSHLVDDPIKLLDPQYNLEIAQKVIEQCSQDRTLVEMLSCYSHGLYDSPKGLQYANKVFEYQNQYGAPFIKRQQPVGILTLAELTHFYNFDQPPPPNNTNEQSIEILTGTTSYEL